MIYSKTLNSDMKIIEGRKRADSLVNQSIADKEEKLSKFRNNKDSQHIFKLNKNIQYLSTFNSNLKDNQIKNLNLVCLQSNEYLS